MFRISNSGINVKGFEDGEAGVYRGREGNKSILAVRTPYSFSYTPLEQVTQPLTYQFHGYISKQKVTNYKFEKL